MTKKLHSQSLKHYVFLVVAYVIASFCIPLSSTTREAYNLSMAEAHVIAFITVLPLFGIWFVAFYAYGLLQRYSTRIQKAPREGFAFQKLTQGIMILAWGLVIQGFASLVLNGLADQFRSLQGPAIVIQNYIGLVFPVIAFSAIATGARHLLTNKHNYVSLPGSRLLLILFALIGTVYSYLVLHLSTTHGGEGFYLPTFLLLSTVVIPYLYAWFSGLVAAFDIHVYARVTNGLLYKRSLGFLSAGIIVLIVASILLQYVNSLLLATTGAVSLNAVVVIDYLLLIGVGLGYGLIIRGIKGLLRIEEI